MIDFWERLDDRLPEPHLRVWQLIDKFGDHIHIAKAIPIVILNKSILEDLGVWALLSEEWKSKVGVRQTIAGENSETNQDENEDGSERKQRKSYKDIPEQITCVQCKQPISINKSQVAKQLETLNVSIETYQKEFKCSVCKPRRRGRQPNPVLSTIPKEMVCTKCKAVVKTVPAQTKIRYEKMGLTLEQFIKQFVCQKCNPTKGRGKGRKPNPAYADIPKHLTCNNSLDSTVAKQLVELKRVKSRENIS
jgi:hypothetical protein